MSLPESLSALAQHELYTASEVLQRVPALARCLVHYCC